jgi:hypothetical protein
MAKILEIMWFLGKLSNQVQIKNASNPPPKLDLSQFP